MAAPTVPSTPPDTSRSTFIDPAGEAHDADVNFVYAVSLLAALEAAVGLEGHTSVLPYLGMARAELTDFGQRRHSHFVDVPIEDVRSGLVAIEARLAALAARSEALQYSLRLDAARRWLRCGLSATS